MAVHEGKIRLLHCRIVTGTGGGPERTILHSPHHLDGTAYAALAAYVHPAGDTGYRELQATASRKGCAMVEIPERHPFDRRVIERLSRLCREHDVRIWHGHDYKSNLFGLLLRRRHGLELVATVHGWVQRTRRTPFYYAVDRFCLRRYDRVVAVSADLHDSCLALGVRPERLFLIENGVETEDLVRRRPASEAPGRNLPPGRLLVGGAGRLSEEKGFHLLIEAAGRLLERGLDLELWIAGEGSARPALERQITASGHADRIRLLGYCGDMVGFLERLDLFVLSSLREGLPFVVLEAMAMELPVLATRAGGMAAFAVDGEHALLCPTGSVEALEQGLERLAGDPDLRRRLGSRARAHVVARYSFARRMRKMLEVYDSLGLVPGAAARAS